MRPVDGPRIDNEVFFASSGAPVSQPTVAEAVFYAGRARPPAEIPLATRAAATTRRFAFILFAIGWGGILFQAGILQQIVFGAPVFEELAKLGPPLLIAALLGTRSPWIRIPLALLSGAAFGVMEHYVTYAEEPLSVYIGRVAFHAVAPALSMLVYGGLEDMPDVRARWAATVPATLFHWANNFMAVVFGFAGLILPFSVDPIAMGWASLVTLAMASVLIAGLIARERFEAAARRVVENAMPRLGVPPPAPSERTTTA